MNLSIYHHTSSMAMFITILEHSDIVCSNTREISCKPVYLIILVHAFNNVTRFTNVSHNTMHLIFCFIKNAVMVTINVEIFSFDLDVIGIKLLDVQPGPGDYF